MSSLSSQLAKLLFRVEGVKGVFFGKDFITITKADDETEWRVIKPQVFAVIMDFFASGLPVMNENAAAATTGLFVGTIISFNWLFFANRQW